MPRINYKILLIWVLFIMSLIIVTFQGFLWAEEIKGIRGILKERILEKIQKKMSLQKKESQFKKNLNRLNNLNNAQEEKIISIKRS